MALAVRYQVVRERQQGTVWSHFFAASLLLLALGWRVHVHLAMTEVRYELAEEQRRTVRLDMERRELELQRSILVSPASLRRSALGLGLVEGDPRRTRTVRLP